MERRENITWTMTPSQLFCVNPIPLCACTLVCLRDRLQRIFSSSQNFSKVDLFGAAKVIWYSSFHCVVDEDLAFLLRDILSGGRSLFNSVFCSEAVLSGEPHPVPSVFKSVLLGLLDHSFVDRLVWDVLA